MIKFDPTISLSELIAVGTMVVAFWRVFLSDRDIKRGMATMLADHESRLAEVEHRQDTHHEWLIRNRMDLTATRRAHDPPRPSHDAT